MKAHELRIGNYLQRNKYVCVVQEINGVDNGVVAQFIEEMPMGMHEYNTIPIPLTEDWLLKFGFEKTVTATEGFFKVRIQYTIGRFFILNSNAEKPSFGIGLHDVWDGISLDLKYVHQLQNLYFALTGEELKVRERAAS